MTRLRSMLTIASFTATLAFTMSASAASCSSVAGNLLSNCGFESGSFSNWTSTATQYAAVDDSNPNSGSYAASLGSTTSAYLYQTVNDVAGAYYSLSFSLDNEIAANASGTPYAGGNSFAVGYQNKSGTIVTLASFTNMAETGVYQSYTYYFYGTGLDSVGFLYDNVPSYFELDDVVFKDPPAPGSDTSNFGSSLSASPTPEPSSLMLMGTGVMALAVGIRRRVQGNMSV